MSNLKPKPRIPNDTPAWSLRFTPTEIDQLLESTKGTSSEEVFKGAFDSEMAELRWMEQDIHRVTKGYEI